MRYSYLRDHSTVNRQCVGCLAVEIDRVKQEIRYALSVCAPSDNFNPARAKEIAGGRMKKKPTILSVEVPKKAHQITRLIMEHIAETHGLVSKEKRTEQGEVVSKEKHSHLACASAMGWLAQAVPALAA